MDEYEYIEPEQITVASGQTLSDIVLNNAFMDVQSGGIVKNVQVESRGYLFVSDGGKASNVSWTPGIGDVGWEDNAYVTFANDISGVFYTRHYKNSSTVLLSHTTVMSGKTISSSRKSWSDEMIVMSGGTAVNTVVKDDTDFHVESGGTASGLTVEIGAFGGIGSGGKLTGKVIIEPSHNALFYIGSGAILDFDIRKASTTGSALVRVNDPDFFSPDIIYTLTINGNEKNGTYKLAENASNFNCSISVVNVAGSELGVLYVGQKTQILGDYYTLNLVDDTLCVTKGSGGASGGSTSSSSVLSYTSQVVSAGQTVNGITAAYHGNLFISSGGTALNTKLDSGGFMEVSSGGVASGITVNKGGELYVESGGTAMNVSWTPCEGWVDWHPGATVTFTQKHSGIYYGYGNKVVSKAKVMSSKTLGEKDDLYEEMNVMSGGTAVDITLTSRGELNIFSGGTAINPLACEDDGEITVYDGGIVFNPTVSDDGDGLYLFGGTAVNPTVNPNGYLAVHCGGKLTGRITVNTREGAWTGTAINDGIIDFDLTCTSPGADALVNNLNTFSTSFPETEGITHFECDFTLTVDGSLSNGIYWLAENASGFNETITIVNTSGSKLGSIMVGQSVSLNGKSYTLYLSGSSLSVTVQSSGNTPAGDTVAPTVTNIQANTTGPAQSVTVTAVFKDDVKLEKSLYRIGETGAWKEYSDGVTVTENTTVCFKAVDSAGNESEIARYDVTNIQTVSDNIVSGRVISDEESAFVSAGTIYKGTMISGGILNVLSGGTAIATTADGGRLNIYTGGTANSTTVNQWGTMHVSSGGMATDVTISGGWGEVDPGGSVNLVTIKPGGGFWVESGGTATNIVWTPCEGRVSVSSGGTATFVSKYSGVYFGTGGHLVSSAKVMNEKKLSGTEDWDNQNYDEMYVMSGGTASGTTVSGGSMYVMSGGTASGTTVVESFYGLVVSGGIVKNTFVDSDASVCVSSGGTASDTIVTEGGELRIYEGGTADNTFISGGRLHVESGGTATNIDWTPCGGTFSIENGAVVTFVSEYSGVYLGSEGQLLSHAAVMIRKELDELCEMNVMSGGTAFQTEVAGGMTVWSGGTANSVTLYGGDPEWEHVGSLYVSSGGTATNIDIGAGARVSFDVAPDTYMQGIYEDADGEYALLEMKNGVLSGYTLSGGNTIRICSGGTADGIVMRGENPFIYLFSGGVMNNTVMGSEDHDGFSFGYCEVSGGVANNTVVYGDYYLFCNPGAVLNSTTLRGSYANFVISSGGTANDTSVFKGHMNIRNGGVVSNVTVDFEPVEEDDDDGGFHSVHIATGGRLTGRITILNGTISADLGSILDFDLTGTTAGAPALVNDLSKIEGMPVYTLTVDGSVAAGDYKLAEGASEFNGVLSVVNTDGTELGTLTTGKKSTINGNDYTVNLADGKLTVTVKVSEVKDTTAPTVTNITADITTQTNQNVTVTASFDDNVGVVSRLYRMGKTGAWLSYVDGVTVTENTTVYFKAIDAAGNESTIASYKVSNIRKGGSASDDPVGMPDGGRNNWLYDKKLGINPDRGDFIKTEVSASTEEIPLDRDEDVTAEDWLNYVGPGDEYDFAKISLENDAKLSFNATATGAAKFAVYRLTPGTGKKAGTYTMKALQTTTLKKPKNETKYTAETKELLLVAGDYYIAMQSTTAKKGGTAFYNVNLNEKSVFFTNGDDGWNNWLCEKKIGLNPNINDFITTVISPSTEEIQMDRDEDVDSEDWLNFVGYDDPADFAKIVLESNASLSFTIRATDAAKFVIYKLNGKADKNGGITYSLKALQTTKLKKGKNDVLYTADTKNLMLEAGKYYISVQSTNAKKGGNAYYSVCLNEERSWFAWYDLDSIAAPDVQLAGATGSPAESDALNAFDNAFDGGAADLATAGFEGLTDAKLSDWQDLAKLA